MTIRFNNRKSADDLIAALIESVDTIHFAVDISGDYIVVDFWRIDNKHED